MKKNTYGFIGLGLIGGSIAHAIKKYITDAVITAYDPNETGLSHAKNKGIVDYAYFNIDEAAAISIGQCEYIFLCAPVSANDLNLTMIRPFLSDESILTDVGSVKHSIHKTIEKLDLSKHFIGGHPMAGSERSGFDASDAKLLENAYYILTPTKEVSAKKIASFKTFISTLRAIPLILDYSQHDYITAAVSHLPHIIASSLVHLVENEDDKNKVMKMIAAGGFKDITRIASSSPVMWESICMTNTDNIVKLLDAYISYLKQIKSKLIVKDSQYIYQFFDEAKAYRDSFNNIGSGPIKKIFVLYVDLKDEAGAIAKTASLLASVSVSIKNIGIMHNREVQDGSLRIEFYDESSMELAKEVLYRNHYNLC